jgi:cytosine/adenosine deaminase-related metal-dependent hydrolase
MIKGIAEHVSGGAWRLLKDFINHRCTSEDFWHAEGQLVGLERLKFGTTCFAHRLAIAPAGDDISIPEANMRGIAGVGLRHVTAVGPPRPPFPATSSVWRKGVRRDAQVSLEDCFRVADKVIRKCHGMDEGRTSVWIGVSRPQAPSRNDPLFKPEYLKFSVKQAKIMKRLMEKHGVGLHMNAYGGVVKWCFEKLGLLGPDVVLAHCTDLSRQEIRYMRDTGTNAVHCPTARRYYTYIGHCPVVELIDAGVPVALSNDYAGLDRTADQFKDIKLAITLQRLRFRDPSYLPPGKALEMVTIDAARCLGMDRLVGSIEAGKKADIILIEMEQAHLKPLWMIPQRVAYQVTGHDVDTALVDGKILMEGRKVKSVNEKKVLREAQREGECMVERSGVTPLMGLPDGFWGHSRY